MTRTKPVVVDICCGRGGWSKGFIAEGFDAIGFDIFPHAYPGRMVLQDARTMTAKQLRASRAEVVVASTPCEQFSLFGMKMFHPDPPYPALGIEIFNHVREICEESGIPYVMENVRPAQGFVGQSVNHAGPFHLWGTGVPAILPQEAYAETKKSKGMNFDRGYTGIRAIEGARSFWSNSDGRREMQALIAEIPFSLSHWIARCFKPEEFRSQTA